MAHTLHFINPSLPTKHQIRHFISLFLHLTVSISLTRRETHIIIIITIHSHSSQIGRNETEAGGITFTVLIGVSVLKIDYRLLIVRSTTDLDRTRNEG